MAVKNQNWMLFGIDTLKLARICKSSWMELLWGEDSPLRNRLDEKIIVQSLNLLFNVTVYQRADYLI